MIEPWQVCIIAALTLAAGYCLGVWRALRFLDNRHSEIDAARVTAMKVMDEQLRYKDAQILAMAANERWLFMENMLNIRRAAVLDNSARNGWWCEMPPLPGWPDWMHAPLRKQ